jgi:predicted transcriptional regulator
MKNQTPLSMLTIDLSSQTIPYLQLRDKVYQALQMMNDNQVTHLPIVDGDKYVGIVSEDDLMQAENEHAELGELQQSFSNTFVKSDEHFLKAIQVAAENGLSVVPIVDNENDIVGAVAYNDLLKRASEFMSLHEPGGLIVLEMQTNQYSFSEISKILEANDVQITQLNTFNDTETGIMRVTIRINKPDISNIVAAFQRYEYDVKYFSGEELFDNELRSNYENLMNYLKF